MRTKKITKTFLVILLLILCATVLWFGSDIHRFAKKPAGTSDDVVVISITPGQSFNQLTADLKKNNLISSALRFKLVARITRDDKRLKAGEYALTATMSPLKILDNLVHGKVMLHRLTIPEGYTIEQIAMELDRIALVPEELFEQWTRDPIHSKLLGISGPTLEGYLFPDTYYFPKGVSAEDVANKMVQRFNQTFTESWRQRAKAIGFTVHEIVTLASIIEKETGDPAERPLIASVFHNRLKKKMRLESDPTVIYGIENFDGNITRRHLKTATPYNTYVIRGLPPGPIANPGRAALEAALYPAETNYIFFVSKKDGTHHFSSTIKEHNRAVRKYQLRRRHSKSK